jgi:DNA-directed RNA polymerase delta subunit
MSGNTKKINVKKITFDIVNSLSQRQKEVLIKRFGLLDGKRRTLEDIGKGYDITRERVRQIENDAKAAIAGSEKMKDMDPFFESVKEHIDSHGKVRVEHDLLGSDLKEFFPKSVSEKEAEAIMYFLLSVSDRFVKIPETPDFYTIWSTDKSVVHITKAALDSLINKLKDHSNTVSKEDLLEWLSGFVTDKMEKKALASFLGTSKHIGENVYGDYGLKNWPEISTKGVRDKAYLVLKKHGNPMHFRHVVDNINKNFELTKKAHPQTVHNELIKDGKFVLVGRGTYALSEWGFKPGTVSEVLARILKDSDKPMQKEELLEAVLKERDVKENTVSLNLQNKDLFEKMEDGGYIYRA